MILPAPMGLADRPLSHPRRHTVRVEQLVKRFPVRRGWAEMVRHPLRKEYMTAVDRVDFTAEEGEIIALLGANGAGKTTLLKILSTLIIPDEGRAEVGGFDVTTHPDEVRKILAPVAADERSLDWRLSAVENLRFFGSLLDLRGASLRARIDHALSAVDLTDTGSKLVGSFSSGMRQRLLIARGLLSQPRILVLDEPTRSLDPLAARAFRAFLRRDIAEGLGCTVLLATHDPDEALDMADRVSILHRGRLLAMGTSAELTRSFSGERYRIWTRTPDHPRLRALVADGSDMHSETDEHDALPVVEFDLPASAGDSGEILAELIAGGAHVARFERVQMKLPDLMGRVMKARTEAADA